MSEDVSHLLALPREVREQIFTLALQQTWPPPRSSWDVKNTQEQHWMPPGMTLVSRQCHREITSLAAHLANSQRPASLDLAVLTKGNLLASQWTRLCQGLIHPGGTVDLNVDLCILSTEGFPPGLPLADPANYMLRYMACCLERFLSTGPVALDNMCSLEGFPRTDDVPAPSTAPFQWQSDPRVSIRRLEVNIRFQDDYTPDTWAGAVHAIFRWCKALTLQGQKPGHNQALPRIVKAKTAYTYRGVETRREQEWDAQTLARNASKDDEASTIEQ